MERMSGLDATMLYEASCGSASMAVQI